MVNSNPETVSTDFDTSDRLYFEPLDEESLRDVVENETEETAGPPPAVVQFGGQTAINLSRSSIAWGCPFSAPPRRPSTLHRTGDGSKSSLPAWASPSLRAPP